MPLQIKALTRAAVIAALYTALTLLLAPISFGMTGAVQLRVAEALTVLPILLPEAVPALFVGCLLSNLLGGAALPDVILGSLATLLAAVLTRLLRKHFWAAASMPVLVNALVVGTLVHLLYTPFISLPLCMLYVGLGQAIACYGLGWVLLQGMKRVPEKLLS